jgi:hypothetical protein
MALSGEMAKYQRINNEIITMAKWHGINNQ